MVSRSRVLASLAAVVCGLLVSCVNPVSQTTPPLATGAVQITGRSWVYSVGGRDRSGNPTCEVFRASLGTDGSLGPWEPETPLPGPLADGVGVFLHGMLHVYGGPAGAEFLAPVNDEGAVGFGDAPRFWEQETRTLPEVRTGGILVNRGTFWEWRGGTRTDGSAAPPWFVRPWSDGQTGYWYRWPVLPWGSLDLGTSFPRVFPFAGFVPSKTPLSADLVPGDRLVYTRSVGAEASDPTDASAVYDPAAPPQPADNEVFRWRTFRNGAPASAVLRTSYRIKNQGLVTTLQGILRPVAAGTPVQSIALQEVYSNGTSSPTASVAYQLALATDQDLEFLWTDLDSGPPGRTDTAPVRVSVVEGDQMTPAWDSLGREMLLLSSPWPDPVRARLPRGTYYLSAARTDKAKGGSFSLVVRRP